MRARENKMQYALCEIRILLLYADNITLIVRLRFYLAPHLLKKLFFPQ